MKKIKKISALETYPVRHPVLREGKSIESCHFDGDNLETTIHFGLYLQDNIIGVVSVFESKNEIFTNKKQFQIRGMAVLKEQQRKKFGAELIIATEKHCFEQKPCLIWFNARKEAIEFYKKMGYKTNGLSFEIKDIGTHIIMSKNCSSSS
ncbi:GNAT family N-acetyltransferase [Flavobacterium sp. I-SCBP12n]|uniref:GNAT family N-acetyltransferase n=1 Tax=Flavobacterium pygoscelis TaxID=2893176 RepID=A0A9X2BLS0_9FLAO|nr:MULTISPECIES: GNAT family N-acetyltransferase [Flavobacterium]MCK8142088.1 GNAT family N-acetyltransferase [Flavobacterium pygoscelis]